MPPRYLERMQRQSEIHREVFGEPSVAPPPYPSSYATHNGALPSIKSTTRRPVAVALPTPPPPYDPSPSFPPAPAARVLGSGSLILVTGANGYQGSHVVDQLLQHGYRVRGTVRTAEKAIWTVQFFRDKYGPGRYTTAVIPDMLVKGAFDLAIRDCAGVIHCASVTTYSPDPNEVIIPSIAGALNALVAASREPQMRRFVYCSATAAAVSHDGARQQEVTIDTDSWNMSSFERAWACPPYHADRAWDVFASSKMQTEQAVWRWYGDHRPTFTLNAVLPSTLWGPLLSPKHQGRPSSLHLLSGIIDASASATAPQTSPPQSCVDVTDSALLHLAALLLPDVRDQRIFAAAASYTPDSIRRLLEVMYPERSLGASKRNDHDDDHQGFHAAVFQEEPRAVSLLKRMGRTDGWTTLETSLAGCCGDLIDRGR